MAPFEALQGVDIFLCGCYVASARPYRFKKFKKALDFKTIRKGSQFKRKFKIDIQFTNLKKHRELVNVGKGKTLLFIFFS